MNSKVSSLKYQTHLSYPPQVVQLFAVRIPPRLQLLPRLTEQLQPRVDVRVLGRARREALAPVPKLNLKHPHLHSNIHERCCLQKEDYNNQRQKNLQHNIYENKAEPVL